MLRHGIALQPLGAVLEDGAPDHSGGDAAAQAGEKGIAAGLDQLGMESLVGGAAFRGAQRLARHDLQRLPHLVRLLQRAALGSQGGDGRLDDTAQFEQGDEQFQRRLLREHPEQDVRIHQVPLGHLADPSARFGPRRHQTFRHQDADGFAIGGARDLALAAGRYLVGQGGARLELAGDDLDADLLGDLAGNALFLGDHGLICSETAGSAKVVAVRQVSWPGSRAALVRVAHRA